MRRFLHYVACVMYVCIFWAVIDAFCGFSAYADCRHSNTWPRIDYSVGGPMDSYSHYIIGSGWYECSDCGVRVESISVTQDAPHEFNSSGKCKDCGYKKTSCSHEFQEISSSRFKYEKISGNSKEHLLICYVTWTCPDCGKVTLNDERWYSEEEAHQFSSSGKCIKCGYQKSSSSTTCNHSNTKRVYGNTTYEAIDGNDTYHNEFTPINTVCNSCGKIISTSTKNGIADHSFTGNKCNICGYTKDTTSYTSRPHSSSGIAISMYEGIATLSWSDTGNNGPYNVFWEMESYECSDQPYYAEYSVRGKQLNVYGMIPGQRYSVEIFGQEGFVITGIVQVPYAAAFVDGRLKDTSIKTTIEYRYRLSEATEYKQAQVLDSLRASTMESGIASGKRYGIRYTIKLPQLASSRYFETKKVFRAPNGFCMAECDGQIEYSDFNHSSSSTRYWYCCGEEFFEILLENCGYIPTGVYYVDLYWDGMLVNTNSFRVY